MDLYVKDAWKVLNQAIEKKFVSVNLLNGMCKVMVNAQKLAELEGLVLPLYD